jgi:hypothetical protein
VQRVNKQLLKKVLTVIGYVAVSLLLLTTTLSAYGGMVDPNKTAIPALLAMTFPLWAIATVIALIVTLFCNRRMAIIPAATLLICIGPLLDFCPMHCGSKKLSAEEEARSFTLLSYNTYGLEDYHKGDKGNVFTSLQEQTEAGITNPTLLHILDMDADIVCMQEWYACVSFNRKSVSSELYDRICETYPYRIWEEDNVIFSKYPIEPLLMSYRGGFYTSYIGAVADIQGHKTLITCAHFESIGLNKDDKELYREITDGEGGKQAISSAKHQLLYKLSNAFRRRAIQTSYLRERIDSLGIENVIIAGDFNDIYNSYALRQLTKDDFKAAFVDAACGPTITYHANRFFFQIDHILYRGQFKAVDFQRDDFDRSDHYPIMAKFTWNNTNKST